jgi:GNAT superfamily N-acetyltransferase
MLVPITEGGSGMAANTIVHIQKATREDVPLILEFIRELADYENLLDSVTATEERLHATLFCAKSYAEAILAFQHDRPVAFAIYFFNYSTFAGLPGLYLEDIYVRPTFRGLGVGRELLRFLARKAIASGCGRMQWSVLNWNQSAMDFYTKLGAVPINDWTVFRLANEQLAKLAAEPPGP